MIKFEIGDKVIISLPTTAYVHNGKYGVIKGFFHDPEIVTVELNDGSENYDLIFNVANLKLLESVKSFKEDAYLKYFLDNTYNLIEELKEDYHLFSIFDISRLKSTVEMISKDSFLKELAVTSSLLSLLETIYSNNDSNWVINEIRDLYHVLKESLENN
jgi:hypothetical protein